MRRPAKGVNALNRSTGLALGVALLWFSLLVMIPLTAVVVQATTGGWDGFLRVLGNPQTRAAIEADGLPVAAGDGDQHRDGHDDCVGARA